MKFTTKFYVLIQTFSVLLSSVTVIIYLAFSLLNFNTLIHILIQEASDNELLYFISFFLKVEYVIYKVHNFYSGL